LLRQSPQKVRAPTLATANVMVTTSARKAIVATVAIHQPPRWH